MFPLCVSIRNNQAFLCSTYIRLRLEDHRTAATNKQQVSYWKHDDQRAKHRSNGKERMNVWGKRRRREKQQGKSSLAQAVYKCTCKQLLVRSDQCFFSRRLPYSTSPTVLIILNQLKWSQWTFNSEIDIIHFTSICVYEIVSCCRVCAEWQCAVDKRFKAGE